SRSTAKVNSRPAPPAPADHTTASCPLMASASWSVDASCRSSTSGDAPASSIAAAWCAERIVAVTECPASTSFRWACRATLPWPPRMMIVDMGPPFFRDEGCSAGVRNAVLERGRARSERVRVLLEEAGADAECESGVVRPGGVAQQRAPEEDRGGLLVGDERIGLLRGADAAHGRGEGAALGPDSGRIAGLVLLVVGDRHHVDAARGAVDEIDAPLGRPPGELHGLGEGPRLPGVVGVLLDPVGGRDAQGDRLVSGPRSADRVDHLEHDAG